MPTVPFLIRGALSPSKNKQLQPNSEEEKEVTVRNPNVPKTTEASTSKSRKVCKEKYSSYYSLFRIFSRFKENFPTTFFYLMYGADD